MSLAFEIDPESIGAARDITSALRHLSTEAYEEPERRYEFASWSGEEVATIERTEKFQRPRKARAVFGEVTKQVAKDVDLKDIGENVAAHDELQHAAAVSQISLPLLKIGNAREEEPMLPCLFAQKNIRNILGPLDALNGERVHERMKELAETCFEPEQIVFAPPEDFSRLFFDGLDSFLAVRIAGTRWLRSDASSEFRKSAWRGPVSFRGGGGGGGTGGSATPGQGGGGQWWKANTQGSGLVLYWANRFGAKVPPTSLGGKTTPLDIFLSFGDGFIGADAGPSHTVRWDPALVQVPSHNPVFTTNQF